MLTIEEFMILVRKEIGYYMEDSYWIVIYNNFNPMTKEIFESNKSLFAINAIATDYARKYY